MRAEDRIANALDLIRECGSIDGARHKAWVIDQVVRFLTAEQYDAWITETRRGPDGPHSYDWDCGIPP